jgi:archaemetzincin
MPSLSRRALLLTTLGGGLGACEKPERRGRPLVSGLGSVRSVPPTRRRLDPFDFDAELFEKKRRPERGDWLAEHAEAFQSFEAYVASHPVRPTRERFRIVFQPLGTFSDAGKALFRAVRDHAELFFAIEVITAPPMPLPRSGRRTRDIEDVTSWVQHHTGTILKVLAAKLPADAVAYLGVTDEDLYPEPSWNFVFGEASLTERVGTYSLARFLPPFARVRDFMAVRRSVQLLAHETAHVFSLPHCVRFECVMNGSNSLAESDRAPVEPCPDCLRKLAYALGFDPLERYRALHRFFERRELVAEALWIARRLSRLA